MRVFAALPLPPAVLGVIGETAASLKKLNPRLRMTGESGMHLTLHFFGEIGEAEVEALGRLWDQDLFARPKISASLGPLGCFPGRGTPRVVWIGIDRGFEELKAVNAGFQKCISALGYREDPRGFNPHITLARNGAMDPVRLAGVRTPKADFAFEKLVLFQSLLRPSGAEYLVLKGAAFTEAET